MAVATEGLTFEKVWAMFQETDRQFKETDRKFEELREDMKETDRRFQETDRQLKKTDWKISKLGNRLGDLIEHLAASNLLKKFRNQGYVFNRISRNITIEGENQNALAEIDILLENGRYAMVVEVKSLFTLGDVKDHLKRMKILRAYADAHDDRRKYLAAAAGALIEAKSRACALENGMFVIEQAGDRVNITAPSSVREW
jgi:hypothetical protein